MRACTDFTDVEGTLHTLRYFCEAFTGCESSLFYSNWFGLEPVQGDFHYDFTGMADCSSGRAADLPF